uniref:Prostaglandin F2 receptor inhibitor n=1 Tax=Ornithorhynchus anatinus TaxID=9258 RepID=A0A6I8NN96_ORNAN
MGPSRERPIVLVLLSLALCPPCRGRVVNISMTSLVRVVGTEAVIPCRVSDYEGPREQNFDWTFSPSEGSSFEPVVSTWEPAFTAPLFEPRVASGEIQLRRTGHDGVELLIRPVGPADQGRYKCSTPSTDATVQGNYEDVVHVRVLTDELHVGAGGQESASLRVAQGDPLELQCSASTATAEHTHLAVRWEVWRGPERHTVLSLTHMGRLRPGPEFEQRYRSGDVRLDTAGEDSFRLSVARAQLGDQGAYRCVVSEWVSEAGSWQEIQEKSVDVANVTVHLTALSVTLRSQNVSVAEGSDLALNCTVTAAARSDVIRTAVTWYFSGGPDPTLPPHARVLASLDHRSVLRALPRVGLSHVAPGSYRLLVRDAGPDGTGYYFCRAALWAPGPDGSWNQVAEGTSAPARVQVTTPEPEFRALLNVSEMPTLPEAPVELECRVVGPPSPDTRLRFAVSWFRRQPLRSDDMAPDELLASMDQDGLLQAGAQSRVRTQRGEMIFSRGAVDRFHFRLQGATEGDQGVYFCAVSAWTRQQNHSWVKSREVLSDPVTVFWAPSVSDAELTVEARQSQVPPATGSLFEMTCEVTSQPAPAARLSVLVTAERPAAAPAAPHGPNGTVAVVSLSRDSVVRLEDQADRTRVGAVVLEKVREREFRYRMYRAQLTDTGLYRCAVTAWLPAAGGQWREAATGLSNPILLDLQTSGPVFNVSVHSDRPTVYRGDLVSLFCIVSVDGGAPDPEDLTFDVAWFTVPSFGPGGAPIHLASLDRSGVVDKARRPWKSDVSLERTSAMEFLLQLHGAEDRDLGDYYCSVTPWVRSATGVWQREPEVQAKPLLVAVRMDGKGFGRSCRSRRSPFLFLSWASYRGAWRNPWTNIHAESLRGESGSERAEFGVLNGTCCVTWGSRGWRGKS